MLPPPRVDIVSAEETDCSTFAEIEFGAIDDSMQGDEQRSIIHLAFGPFDAKMQASRTEDLARQLTTDGTVEMHKAIINDGGADHGKIVAFAQWHYFAEPRPFEKWEDKEWPESRHPDAANAFLGAVAAARNTFMAEQKCGSTFSFTSSSSYPQLCSDNPATVLAVLMTRPGYQGNGFGSALLEFGIAKAKEMGITSFFLEASSDGHRLYQKFDFQDVSTICMDLTKYGGIGTQDVFCMKKT